MKHYSAYAVLCMAAVLLTGCGNTTQMDSLIADYEETDAASAEDTAAAEETTIPAPAEDFVPAEGDIDLTELNATMVYGQVYDMVYNPDTYTGRHVRARGPFAYYKDEETGKEYFAVLISDATACCAQGIEFVLDGNPVYPDDYPETSTEITVSGEFNAYEENGTTYVQLLHAQIEP